MHPPSLSYLGQAFQERLQTLARPKGAKHAEEGGGRESLLKRHGLQGMRLSRGRGFELLC